jgi:SHS2 domain-containing protein
MSYRHLEDVSTADVTFEATGGDLEELFLSAADATMNVMVEELESIRPLQAIEIKLAGKEADMLLFDFLQELIFYKDAEQLLLRALSATIAQQMGRFLLTAVAVGETLDPLRHKQGVDVKAVTLHRFVVERQQDGQWRAFVILDV